MGLHPGQLSFLDADEPPEPPEPPKDDTRSRTTRQRTTRHDKPAEGAMRKRGSATAQRRSTSATATDKSALLTTTEAAALLHVHPRTVQRLVDRGQLCAVHLGSAVRFDPRDVDGLIDGVKRARRARAATNPIRARGRTSGSFAERLRSRRDEHRATQA
jgi:excisionase family DNA binding protein